MNVIVEDRSRRDNLRIVGILESNENDELWVQKSSQESWAC